MPSRPTPEAPADLVLGALAVHRLTRLVTTDDVLNTPRERIEQLGDRWALFITCPWCVSMWVAAGWLALRTIAPRTARAAGAVLASSSTAGLLASWE